MNLYDLLDVDETASPDEIRTKWKAAIADLDPSDRRFRAFNDAAGVLLDDDRRSAYDAELAATRALEEPDAEEPVAEESVAEEPVAEEPEVVAAAPTVADAPPTVTDAPPPSFRPGPPLWTLVVAGVAALAAIALAAWVLALPNAKPAADGNAQLTATDAQVEQLVSDKIVPAMSYDYRTLPADLAGLQKYMTPTMAQQQAEAWKALTPQAKQQHAVVVSHVPDDAPGTGLTRISDDGTRAVVVAYIDQDVRRLATAPFRLTMWATFVLVKDAASGAWQIDQVCTDRVCS